MKNSIAVAVAFGLTACTGVSTSSRTIQVPENLVPSEPTSLAMVVPAKGVQIYECRATAGAALRYEWTFVAPEAELLNTRDEVIGKHYAGPHWEASDGSKIVGTVRARADAPSSGTIPWLLLNARSVGERGAFSEVTSIQRVNTVGGAVPANACSRESAGTRARVPYTADYYFLANRY